MDETVVLINPFSVPQGMEDEFLKMWKQQAEFMKNQPGFIETKLHRSLDPAARFQFINVARWESASAWQAAISKSQIPAQTAQTPFEAHPALYRIEVQY